MSSSGRKRGMAVSAIAALALGGLAFAPAQAQTIAQGEDIDVDLYTGQQSGAYTNQFDGNNSSVQLLAGVLGAADGGQVGQNSVRFSYLKGATQVNIATVPIVNGLATSDWVAPAGAEGAAITDLRAEVLDVTNTILATDDHFVFGTPTPNVGSMPVSIAANNRDMVGLSPDDEIVVTGKTKEAVASVGDSFVSTLVQNEGPTVDDNVNYVPYSTDVADVNALTPYAALVGINPGNLTADPVDEVVVTTRIFAEGDDVRVLSVYDQVVTTIAKATAPGFPANVAGGPANEEAHWVISVDDQNGNPVSGLDIYESDVAGANLAAADGMGRLVDNSAAFDDGETDHNGELTVRLNEDDAAPAGYGIDGVEDQDPAPGVGATYVVVDVNQNGSYDNGIDQIHKLTITNLPQAPASIDIESSLGNVMDADESTELTFTVRDANGDPIQSANVSGTIDRDVADNTPADSSTPWGPLVTDANGEATVVVQPGIDNNAVAVTINATSGSAAGSLAIETDEALTTWDEYPTSQVLANTSTTESGTVALPSGSVLPGRTIGTTLVHANVGDNSLIAPQAEQPAGTITGSPTTASSVTDANGRYSVKVNDPAAPVGQELDNTLMGAASDPGTGFEINPGDCPPLVAGLPPCLDLDLDWLRSLTPTRVEIHNAIGGTTADGLVPGLGGPLRPGGAGIGEVVAFNSDDVELDDIDVNLTIDEGEFVSYADPFENFVIGAPVDFKGVGDTITVNTGDVIVGPGIVIDTRGAFLANIERHVGFDDDGVVQDHLHATAGGASDEHDMNWTTIGNPLNPRATDPLMVELSDDQESSILPKARAGNTEIDAIPGNGSGQIVDYDVNTWDQFENRTQQDTNETDNTPLAGFNSTGTSDFDLNQPSIRAFADSATNQSIEVELEGPVTTTYTDNPANSAFDPNDPLNFLGSNPVVVEDNTETVNWYEVDFNASTFTLGQEGPETVAVQSLVTEVVAATDQEGQPIENMIVDFLRGGPSSEDDDTCNEDLLNNCQRTDGNGQAFYDFVGGSAGTASVTAVMYSAEGVRIATVGPDTVTFSGGTKKVEINAKLSGRSSQGKDILKVKAPNIAKGAKVRLQKKVGNGKWRNVGKVKRLDGSGDRQFGVKDRNGNRVTKYRAKVSGTPFTYRDRTPVKRLK